MGLIPHETVQRVIDAADIVDVVGGYVSLKRRGANYWGLCPFHHDRTPSFAVSKTKGIFKCFACGKSGGTVGFVMEMEQMNYADAIRWLARKYGIEIRERELTDRERQEEDRRQSMFAINELALNFFHDCLLNTEAGRDIGLAYFRERGISDPMIERFRLGYAPDSFDAFLNHAHSKGYTDDELLVETGLVGRSERGSLYDKFRGRVIFPVMTVSGKPVAFGGRVLLSGKQHAKYVNSPESLIYSKRRELYGLYQAKQAVHRNQKCYLVEGYMDVISMSQSGVENVVASSGTALTQQQVGLIHRFTDNVTLIYDSDPAGIKASLRGIDLLLSEGLKIKVVLFPDGEDPDSYAQSHSSSELEQYIASHEEDFIRFKTRILLTGLENDPIARARVIGDIVTSIAVIPDEISRQVYVQECAHMLRMDERVLARQVGIKRNDALLQLRQDDQRRRENEALDREERREKEEKERQEKEKAQQQPEQAGGQEAPAAPAAPAADPALRKFELQLLRYAMRYGNVAIPCGEMAEGEETPPQDLVVDVIARDLRYDEVWFTHPDIAHAFGCVSQTVAEEWSAETQAVLDAVDTEIAARRQAGIQRIADTLTDMARIERAEADLEESLAEERSQLWNERCAEFMTGRLLNHPDDQVRRLASALVISKYRLSKIHSKYAHVADERERLPELVYRALFEFKDAILTTRINDYRQRVARAASLEEAEELLAALRDLNQLRTQFAKCLGDRIIVPRKHL